MTDTLIIIVINCLAAFYFMLPAYIANLSGLVFGGKKPIDNNKTLSDGRRLLGNGVTWTGLIAGTIMGTIIGGIIGIVGLNIPELTGNIINIHMPTTLSYGIIYGFIMGLGALIGDAVGSFIKRRIGIDQGESAPILDQLDFVIMSIILIYPFIPLSINFILIICAMTIILHLLSNSIAYLLGIKDVWY